ncbi:TPA: hypothetical protein F8R99_14190 [Legionella pneumophila]|nr:hypothetical protein [Legionella pneumophila]
MIGFEIETEKGEEFIDVYIEDEARIRYEMNEDNLKWLQASLHNELIEINRIIRERGLDE